MSNIIIFFCSCFVPIIVGPIGVDPCAVIVVHPVEVAVGVVVPVLLSSFLTAYSLPGPAGYNNFYI